MKTILKFAYIAFALVIGFVIGFYAYYSSGYNYYSTITKNAISANDYIELARIHGGCFSKDINVDSNSKVTIAIIPAAVDYTASTYVQAEDGTYTETSHNCYEDGYYCYVTNPTFDMDNYKVGDLYYNNTAIRFVSATGYYDYYFNQDSDVNKSYVDEHPATLAAAVLNGERTSSTYYEAYGFYSISISKTAVDAITAKIGTITGYEIMDSQKESDPVLISSFKFDFSQEFFKDVESLVTAYNKYLTDSANSVDGAADTFNTFYYGDGTEENEGFYKTFLEIDKNNDGEADYSFRHEDSYLQPASLIWTTVGICSAYLVIIIILYMLLFHFDLLKRMFAKITGKNKNDDYNKPRTYKNKPEAIDAEVVTINPIRHTPSTVTETKTVKNDAIAENTNIADTPKQEETENTDTVENTDEKATAEDAEKPADDTTVNE